MSRYPLSIYFFGLILIIFNLSALSGQTITVDGIVNTVQGQPVVLANISVPNTTIGTVTDAKGNFTISIPDSISRLYVSHVRYKMQAVELDKFTESKETLLIILEENVIQFEDITVRGTLVAGEGIPITHITIDKSDIEQSLSMRDLPQIIASQPGVYVTSSGGLGMNDSQVRIRGFDEKRLQVLVNNVPINDPETKDIEWVYWSNLAENARIIQVQRGVGGSLYGSGALGGVINVITADPPTMKEFGGSLKVGSYGQQQVGSRWASGWLLGKVVLESRIQYVRATGWRMSNAQEGLWYYLSGMWLPRENHSFRFHLHGTPTIRAHTQSSAHIASFAESDQFTTASQINGGQGRKNIFGQYAYGFGSAFNGSAHVLGEESNLVNPARFLNLADALFMRPSVKNVVTDEPLNFYMASERLSLNNQVSHRPQLDVHYQWQLSDNTQLKTTLFVSRGLDMQDYVYPAWYIPRDSEGSMYLSDLYQSNFYGADQVFGYRDYHQKFQTGLLSALSTLWKGQELSAGLETRYWNARHAGRLLNTFTKPSVPVPIASVVHHMKNGDRFYDFTTTKPQVSVFGHALWSIHKWKLMTNLQATTMYYNITEQVPSNKNYPNYLDSKADVSHGGDTWTGTATWDHDMNPLTPKELVEYTLWDYRRSFQYFTFRSGVSRLIGKNGSMYLNVSRGIKEPEIKHFFGFGAPREDIELERTTNFELGIRWSGDFRNLNIAGQFIVYRIDFAGKLMEITIPEKANQPGYDYAGHYYVPIGDARYEGLETNLTMTYRNKWLWSVNVSKMSNTWGEPVGSDGAQRLYGNEADAGIDYYDLDGDGIWDEGGNETALHHNFVTKYGRRVDVGMPQIMINNQWSWRSDEKWVSIRLQITGQMYVLENNQPVLVGPGSDNIFGTPDDHFSLTLPEYWRWDFSAGWPILKTPVNLSATLFIQNVLDVKYWQRGDEFGVLPGAPRSIVLGLSSSW